MPNSQSDNQVPMPEQQHKIDRLQRLIDALIAHLDEQQRTIDRLNVSVVLYQELLYAVGQKHPDETRHQTALRYIRQAELQHESVPARNEESHA
mgnify:CR=1 FL=1